MQWKFHAAVLMSAIAVAGGCSQSIDGAPSDVLAGQTIQQGIARGFPDRFTVTVESVTFQCKLSREFAEGAKSFAYRAKVKITGPDGQSTNAGAPYTNSQMHLLTETGGTWQYSWAPLEAVQCGN